MSLYLKNYNIFKIKYIFSVIFILFNLILFTLSLDKINYHKIYFALFVILSTYNFLFCINIKSFFFEKFFTFYMWTGFVFFYFLHIIFFDQNYTFSIGNFNFDNPLHLKELYLVLIFFNLGILVSLIISKKYLFINYKIKDLKFNILIEKKINYFYLIFFFIILIIFFLNNHFKLFDYYFFSEPRYNNFLDSAFKWFFLFGFTSLTCIFLDLKLVKKNIMKLFYIICFQEFLFYLSILSRGCLFNSIAIFFALVSKNFISQKYSIKLVCITFFYIVFLFVINFYILIDKRASNSKDFQRYRGLDGVLFNETNDNSFINISANYYFGKTNSHITLNKFVDFQKENISNFPQSNFKKKIEQLVMTVKNRIFGIDSLMAIVAYEKKNFTLFKLSLEEKFNPGISSFFDTIRLQNNLNENTNNLTLPSIVGFLYYSGSYLFVLFSSILIMLICSLIEKFNIYLNNNIYLSALIGQLIAYRLWHFGYAPLNSYKYFLSIILSIFIIFVLTKILVKNKILIR